MKNLKPAKDLDPGSDLIQLEIGGDNTIDAIVTNVVTLKGGKINICFTTGLIELGNGITILIFSGAVVVPEDKEIKIKK